MRVRKQESFVLGTWLALVVLAASAAVAENDLRLNLRSRAKTDGSARERQVTWEAKKTALIICDMWDDHWCKSAARRVTEMAGPLNEVVKAARARGVFIIHAPSTCTGFYDVTPQRKRAREALFSPTPIPLSTTERWGTAWCWTDPKHEAVLPIDDSDMGCDCLPIKCPIREAWTRQIQTIDIAEPDAITDNGQETWNLLAERGIDNVILSGVHLNMCVLGRPFAIRQMVKLGKNVALMRDLTDTMYNPERPPGVSHFAGTDLVIQHVERYWCPSFTSTDITGKAAFRFQTPGRIKAEASEGKLVVHARLPGRADWFDLAVFVMATNSRPYLHPVRDASGKVVLTDDRPADHPWQHGIFTGFHRVNGFNYWKEDEGKQRFVRLSDLKQAPHQVSWRALVELVAPNGDVVIEEENTITIHAPESADAYVIDFDLLLRAGKQDVRFGKFFVGGLSVRMPWDKANPRQTHLNSNGLRNRQCEQQRAAWCNVERPFGNEIFGIAIFDHPGNPNHPPGWRADEQGLINPNVSALGDWTLAANQAQRFRYHLLVYRGTATREQLAKWFENFFGESR